MTIPMRVICAVPAFNAGDTTRGIEIARSIRDVGAQRGYEAEITFMYPCTNQSFEKQIRQAGFPVRPVGIGLSDEQVATIMHADHAGTEFISNPEDARRVVQACVSVLETDRPDLVVFGFMPMAGIAAQLLHVPSVSYVPFPVYRPWVQHNFLKDIPDEFNNALVAHAPYGVRRRLASAFSMAVPYKGFFRQPTLSAAGQELGWHPTHPDLFAMLDADIQLVHALPADYAGEDVGPHTRIAGPLFNRPANVPVAPEILRQFASDTVPRVFVSMGSSGERRYLLAAIEAVAHIACRAVVVVPPHVCSLAEARQRLDGASHVLLTDQFVPAHMVNPMADFAVIHGGQGTVQTAMFSGTPVVGVGMQWEQSANLDQFVRRGAGIRIARNQWNPATVEQALRQLIASPSYRGAARRLKVEFDAIDGRQITGDLIWDLMRPSKTNSVDSHLSGNDRSSASVQVGSENS